MVRFAGSAALTALVLAGCGSFDTGGGADALATAPSWLIEIEGSGTWQEPSDAEVVRAWVDARVANLRYHKRVFVEVAAPYGAGPEFMRSLVVADYEQSIGGAERWGTDAIEIYPDGGPNARSLAGPVVARLRIQHDLDGDGRDEMAVTGWFALYGEGPMVTPDADDPWAPGRVASPARGDGAPPDVYFAPFEDAGAPLLSRIDALIERADQVPPPTLHAAVFNITDDEVVDRLIDAHVAGVDVRLVFDGRKFRPWYDWYRGDDRLVDAGVPLLGVRRSGTGAMHDKIALFDGRQVATGSANWEHGARFANHENTLYAGEPGLVAAYARRFEALAGQVAAPLLAAPAPSAPVSVSFAPDQEPHRIVGRLIDDARERIYVAMFTAKDVVYREDGGETSILRKLVAAHQRGVDVRVIIDHGIHEASEYHGVESPDDPTDEWLEEQGVGVIRADNQLGPYASMHHKFLVVDDDTVVTGAFNWYHDAAYRNDEDQLVWRDPGLARRYLGELADLARRYDPEFDAGAWPAIDVAIEVHHPGTRWGQSVVLVGDLPELGAWDPARGVVLDAGGWPRWRGQVQLPLGTRFAYKLAVVDERGGVSWEWGDDRRFAATGAALTADYRR